MFTYIYMFAALLSGYVAKRIARENRKKCHHKKHTTSQLKTETAQPLSWITLTNRSGTTSIEWQLQWISAHFLSEALGKSRRFAGWMSGASDRFPTHPWPTPLALRVLAVASESCGIVQGKGCWSLAAKAHLIYCCGSVLFRTNTRYASWLRSEQKSVWKSLHCKLIPHLGHRRFEQHHCQCNKLLVIQKCGSPTDRLPTMGVVPPAHKSDEPNQPAVQTRKTRWHILQNIL